MQQSFLKIPLQINNDTLLYKAQFFQPKIDISLKFNHIRNFGKFHDI